MNPAQGPSMLQQQEDDKPRDVKPVVKTLNRVPRSSKNFLSYDVYISQFRHIFQVPVLVALLKSCLLHLDVFKQNACRKQKMRCEGADNPPCKRCRNAGLECLFEKPSREATLTGEAGLE